MSTPGRCQCQSCTIRGLTGPAIVIAIGVLYLLSQTKGGHFDFQNTWPVILLVIGLLQLSSAFASREGHIDAQTPTPVVTPPPPAPPANPGQTYLASREQ
jgi:hypothetical protein